jgi:excisionase family DNA binding protein
MRLDESSLIGPFSPAGGRSRSLPKGDEKDWGEKGEDRELGAPGQARGSPTREVLPEHNISAERADRSLGRGDPYLVSEPQAARLLGISKDLAYDLARRGELPGAIQLGRRWRVSLIRLRAVIHRSEDPAAEDAR